MNEELPEITTAENDASVRGIKRESASLHVNEVYEVKMEAYYRKNKAI